MDRDQAVMFPYRYVWGPRLKRWPRDSALNQLDRKGALCRVIVKTKPMNSALIEFEDGERAVVSRNALRLVLEKRRGCDGAYAAA